MGAAHVAGQGGEAAECQQPASTDVETLGSLRRRLAVERSRQPAVTPA
jgi:hypothetical protein